MADSVKYIFKTLIKVPCIILVCYMILNAFMFVYSYFKVLGLSYVVMQTAVENNYLPNDQLAMLDDYAKSLAYNKSLAKGSVLSHCRVVPGKLTVTEAATGGWGDGNSPWTAGWEPKSDGSARIRHQYGASVTCGVVAKLDFIWPLDTREVLDNPDDQYLGWNSTGTFGGFADDSALESRRADKGDGTSANRNNVVIMFTVPGLKYYPDLMYGE